MVRPWVLLGFLAACPAFSSVQLLSQLPNNAVSTCVQLDSAGNIYLAGYFAPSNPVDPQDAFAAKLSADGSKVLYYTVLRGLASDAATALALAADGSAYVAGNTNSLDFPVTAGAYQTTYTGGGSTAGFLAKLNPSGAIAYATFLNGNAPAATQITGMTLDPSGAVLLTGIGGPAYSPAGTPPAEGFVLKFDSALARPLLSEYGYGGGLIQLDAQGDIYLAGAEQPNLTAVNPFGLTLPTLSANAFQTTHAAAFCLTLNSGPGGPGGSAPCRHQYVAKLSPAGALIWATYVTGTYGATARGMAVDSSGNVILAGTTNSDDYPVTAGAFQTAYTAAAPPLPVPAGNSYRDPPPSTGYVTKVNSTGTALVWSSYFGGSGSDTITGMAVTPSGDLVVSGLTASSDLPAVSGTPDGCRASAVQRLGFLARVSADGAKAGPSQLVTGAPDCTYLTCNVLSDYTNLVASWPLALRPDATAITAGTNGTVASADFSTTPRLACMTDPAGNVQLRSVAPGQLVSLFGDDLAPAAPLLPANGVAPSTSNFGVYFNGVAAPILYSSAQQINVQVPFEIAGQNSVQMQIIDNQVPLAVRETRTVPVAGRDPAIYLSTAATESAWSGYTQCGGLVEFGVAAIALNADGTLNDCTNPAPAGSTVTLFVNGLGLTVPALATGAISPSPAVALTPAVVILNANLQPIAAATATVPGAITGLASVQFHAPAPLSNLPGVTYLSPQVSGQSTRERLILIWTR